MVKKVFDFKGSIRGKFFIAGANYVRKPLRLSRDNITILQYVENNYAEVCEDACVKGFCNGQCKNCPIQGAKDQAMTILASRPQPINISYNINNCRNVFISEPCARDRGIKFGLKEDE